MSSHLVRERSDNLEVYCKAWPVRNGVDHLVEATQQIMRHLPGYISANIHKSLDGTRVTNYAQWRSQADFEAMQNNPEAVVHMRAASQLATSFEPHLYEVSFIDTIASS